MNPVRFLFWVLGVVLATLVAVLAYKYPEYIVMMGGIAVFIAFGALVGEFLYEVFFG